MKGASQDHSNSATASPSVPFLGSVVLTTGACSFAPRGSTVLMAQ